jgi:hypothetical protein
MIYINLQGGKLLLWLVMGNWDPGCGAVKEAQSCLHVKVIVVDGDLNVQFVPGL